MQQSSCDCWQELVDQVRKGARPEDALGLQVPQKNFNAEEFWQRLVVNGVGDTPLSFLPPDLSRLLEGAAPVPQEDLVVLPPCLCLDTVLQPEFVLPPAQLAEDVECRAPPPLTGTQGKRKREPSPELCSPQSSPKSKLCGPQSSPETVMSSSNSDIIDLTQD